MPHGYPCPECDEPILTPDAPGGTGTCTRCGADSVIPADADVLSSDPLKSSTRRRPRALDRRVTGWAVALTLGIGLVVLAVILLVTGLAGEGRSDTWPILQFFLSPILFLAGVILAGLGLVTRELRRIGMELGRRRQP